jgi:hypothetical protein
MMLKQECIGLGISRSCLARLSGVSRFKLYVHEMGHKLLSADDEARVTAAIRREAAWLAALSTRIAGDEPPEAA